eukprot:4810722-Karenia_brevis.AAC.1
MKGAAKSNGWFYRGVKLPVGNLVLHTGTAVNHVMFCLDAGILDRLTGEASITADVNLHCV